MYFPYIRGRQYELLALRELGENELLGQFVVPILEPVKFSSSLIKTLDLYIRKKQVLAVIENPAVGTFIQEFDSFRESDAENKIKAQQE